MVKSNSECKPAPKDSCLLHSSNWKGNTEKIFRNSQEKKGGKKED